MKNCLFLLLCFYSFFGVAQTRSPDSLRAKIFQLTVKTIPGDSLKLPFESIKIIDSRPDPSKLGFGLNKAASFMGPTAFFRILLKPGIEKGIENFYNLYYHDNFTPNGKTLVISMKKLWINNVPFTFVRSSNKNIARSSQQDIHAKFEFYIGTQDAYLPLKRVDTVFQLTDKGGRLQQRR